MSNKQWDLHFTVKDSILCALNENTILEEEQHLLWTYVTTPPFLTYFEFGRSARKVSDIYDFTVNWIAVPWLLHKYDSCVVVQPTQKKASQVVNFVQQRPGIQWDQWRNRELV